MDIRGLLSAWESSGLIMLVAGRVVTPAAGTGGPRMVVMDDEPGYLVRYGLMGHVGRFPFEPRAGLELERGQAVVVRTDRGLELGEVLVPLGFPRGGQLSDGVSSESESGSEGSTVLVADHPKLLRAAGSEDMESAERAERLRADRYHFCSRLLSDGGWPVELIDVEPLLDPGMTVLHVLGPGGLDLARLRAHLRGLCDFDVVFEKTGASEVAESPAVSVRAAVAGRCGDCDCSGGGCGSGSKGSADVSASGLGAAGLMLDRITLRLCELWNHERAGGQASFLRLTTEPRS